LSNSFNDRQTVGNDPTGPNFVRKASLRNPTDERLLRCRPVATAGGDRGKRADDDKDPGTERRVCLP
jgi:hypothetical protein